LADATAALELLEFQADEELEQELQTNLAQLNCSLEECELEQSLSGPCDKNGAYLIISAAIDDLDALDWAQMLLTMYYRWGLNQGYRVALVEDFVWTTYIGINSATLAIAEVYSATVAIDGRCAYGYLKSETGVHLLKRTSPFDITRKRASPATVEVVPMYVEEEIPQQDLEIMWPDPHQTSIIRPYVKIIHLPTGISAISNQDRVQRKNRENALAVLTSKLFAIMQRQEVAEIADIECDRLTTVLNQPIREYQLASDSANQGKVLDVRTGIQTTAVADVLDGKIDSFIKAGVLLKN
jgi:peptide chain release factor 2